MSNANQQSAPTQPSQADIDAAMQALQDAQAACLALGITLPTPGASSTSIAGGNAPDPNALAAGFSAFNQNCPPFHGNMSAMAQQASLSCPNTPLRSGFRSKNEFERVTGKIPIDKFMYGTEDGNWPDWVTRFEGAVKLATNAFGKDRLEELCLEWIPLKLNDAAQPIYARCEKKHSWPELKNELADKLEDPRIRRQWHRQKDAYKKPASISLQVYKANIIGMVDKYSPGLALDKNSHTLELYNRFVAGLETDWREYIEEAIPYTKETIDNAYSFALKYEAKLKRKAVDFVPTAGAMKNVERDRMERTILDVEKLKMKEKEREAQASRSEENQGRRSKEKSSDESSSSSGHSLSNSGKFRKSDFNALGEDSDGEAKKEFIEKTSQAISQALAASMQGMSFRPKGSHKKRTKED